MTRALDLEDRLDLAFARADRKQQRQYKKLSSLGELKAVSKMKPKIVKASFYFMAKQIDQIRVALSMYLSLVAADNAPQEMQDYLSNLIAHTIKQQENNLQTLLLDNDEFHLIAKSLEVFSQQQDLFRETYEEVKYMLDFFKEGKV